MGEIKFRAWDKVNGMFRKQQMIGEPLISKSDVSKGKTIFVNDIFKDEEFIWMQYTGLKDDETGVDIYAGDVVNLYWSDKIGEPHIEKVVMKNPFEYSTEEAMYFVHADMLEVIGNIYENPELLEVKNG